MRSATIHWPARTDVEKHFIWKFKMQHDSKNDAFQRNFLAFLFMFILFIIKRSKIFIFTDNINAPPEAWFGELQIMTSAHQHTAEGINGVNGADSLDQSVFADINSVERPVVWLMWLMWLMLMLWML